MLVVNYDIKVPLYFQDVLIAYIVIYMYIVNGS